MKCLMQSKWEIGIALWEKDESGKLMNLMNMERRTTEEECSLNVVKETTKWLLTHAHSTHGINLEMDNFANLIISSLNRLTILK